MRFSTSIQRSLFSELVDESDILLCPPAFIVDLVVLFDQELTLSVTVREGSCALILGVFTALRGIGSTSGVSDNLLLYFTGLSRGSVGLLMAVWSQVGLSVPSA